MNTIRMTIFLLALSLSGGCASVAPAGVDCAGASVKTIKINYKRHNNIMVVPPKLNVKPGDAIDYKVKGSASRTFKAKGTKAPSASASFAWLDKSGKGGTVGDGESHIVCVPANQDPGEYEYLIEIEGVGTLDPVVRVN